MEEIIHYTDPQSRALRTQSLLDLYQIPHRKVLVELRKGAHKEPGYAKIHPYRRVPALQHGELIIVESGAITLYLADLFADKMHTPAVNTPERARLYEWVFFLQSTLEPIVMEAFDPAKKEASKLKIRELLEAMATRFKGPFVLGAQFTVLDVILSTELGWYKMMDLMPDLEPYTNFVKECQTAVRA
jgi:glutathione S-transferase